MNASPSHSAAVSQSSPPPLRIHTMQQDLAASAPPSRFDMRHRRPLPKSQRMEDLRQKPPEETLVLPLRANKRLTPPVVSDRQLSSPIFLWIAGLVLALILFIIIIAIFITV